MGKIKLEERIKVFSTGKNKFLEPAGRVINAHPVLAEKLINNGFATKTKKV